ncbi:MAG: hypothetical protein R3357_14595 [Burkholderiales bacterium]|nr:hypothetical protein [Burkholderiales bacterium]
MSGTGKDGRITKGDVVAHLERGEKADAEPQRPAAAPTVQQRPPSDWCSRSRRRRS